MRRIAYAHTRLLFTKLVFFSLPCHATRHEDAHKLHSGSELDVMDRFAVFSNSSHFAYSNDCISLGAQALSTQASSLVSVLDMRRLGMLGQVYLAASVLIALVYRGRGLCVIMAIVTYVFALSTIPSMVRVIVHGFHFSFPLWVTATHFFCTAVLSFFILAMESCRSKTPVVVPSWSHFTRGIIPQTCAMVLSIGCANTGLKYVNVCFSVMLGSMTLLVTAALGLCFGKTLDSKLMLPLISITVGLLVVSAGEAQFSALGVLLIFLSILFRAMKVQIQGFILINSSSLENITPIELAAWGGLTSFCLMAAWSTCSEGLQPWKYLADQGTVNLYIILSVCSCAAAVLNTSSLLVLQELGPVAQQVVGQWKQLLLCATAVLALGEVISAQQLLGYAVILVSVAWYNKVAQELEEAVAKGTIPLNSRRSSADG